MKIPQTKSLIMGIETGVIVIGVVVVGYWIFVGAPQWIRGTTPISTEQTIAEGTDLTRTIKDLTTLKRAVFTSLGFFKMQTFRDLRDFSVEIPKEPVGRDNPFTPTEWRIKLGK